MSKTAGNSKNEWVKNSHDIWSTASCSLSCQGAYSGLRPNLWYGSSSSTGEPPFLFQGLQEIEKSASFKLWREMGGQTEVIYWNVEILLHHRPNSFHDEWSREADEGVSAWGWFIHRPKCSGVNDSKGNNQLDGSKGVLTLMVVSPEWTAGWYSLQWLSCW